MGCRGDALVCEKVRHWDACLRFGEGLVVLLWRVVGLGLEGCESCTCRLEADICTVPW